MPSQSRHILLAICSLTIPIWAGETYHVTALGNQTVANAINNSGQIGGALQNVAGIWQNGTWVPVNFTYAGEIYGLNSQGDAAGVSGGYAWLQVNGTATGYPVGTSSSWWFGINDNGQAIGTYSPGYGQRAMIYTGGTVMPLSSAVTGAWIWVAGQYRYVIGLDPNTFSYGTSINNSGQMTGSIADSTNSTSHAFLFSGGLLIDLGSLTTTQAPGTMGGPSIGEKINDLGQIVGIAMTDSGLNHAFLYTGGALQDLGTIYGGSSAALGLNNTGQIVGWSSSTDGAGSHAFVYSAGLMSDLNTLILETVPHPLTVASAINDLGQIVAMDSWGNSYLLSPDVAPTPEAATGWLIGVTMAVLALHRRRGQS